MPPFFLKLICSDNFYSNVECNYDKKQPNRIKQINRANIIVRKRLQILKVNEVPRISYYMAVFSFQKFNYSNIKERRIHEHQSKDGSWSVWFGSGICLGRDLKTRIIKFLSNSQLNMTQRTSKNTLSLAISSNITFEIKIKSHCIDGINYSMLISF